MHHRHGWNRRYLTVCVYFMKFDNFTGPCNSASRIYIYLYIDIRLWNMTAHHAYPQWTFPTRTKSIYSLLFAHNNGIFRFSTLSTVSPHSLLRKIGCNNAISTKSWGCEIGKIKICTHSFIQVFFFSSFLSLQQLSIQFHEMLTSTFEYPSESSFSEEINMSNGDDYGINNESDLMNNSSFLGNAPIGKCHKKHFCAIIHTRESRITIVHPWRIERGYAVVRWNH